VCLFAFTFLHVWGHDSLGTVPPGANYGRFGDACGLLLNRAVEFISLLEVAGARLALTSL
jgi:hypothetical protein